MWADPLDPPLICIQTVKIYGKPFFSFTQIFYYYIPGIDGVVNNAGICLLGLFEWHNVEKERQVFEVNYWGPVRLVKALLPLLKQSRGRIINVSSISGKKKRGKFCYHG